MNVQERENIEDVAHAIEFLFTAGGPMDQETREVVAEYAEKLEATKSSVDARASRLVSVCFADADTNWSMATTNMLRR